LAIFRLDLAIFAGIIKTIIVFILVFFKQIYFGDFMKTNTLLLPIIVSLACSSAFSMENKPVSATERMKTAALLAAIPAGVGIAGSSAILFNQKFPKTGRGAAMLAQLGLSAGLAYTCAQAISRVSDLADELKDPKTDQHGRESLAEVLKISPYCILGSAATSYALGRRGFTNATILKNIIKNK
jgi:O-antigen/teichoic acid export membrane protein